MKSKRHKSYVKFIITIAVISGLSFTGVGYAYWTDSVKISAMVSTGNIKPIFTSAILDKGEYDVYHAVFNPTINPNKDMIEIGKPNKGTIYSGYSGYIKYTVSNEGSLPIKLEEFDKNIIPEEYIRVERVYTDKPSEVVSGAFKFELIQNIKELYNKEDPRYKDISGMLKITPLQDGIYNFTIKIPYNQYTNESKAGPWQKYLTIKGLVSIR